MIAPRRFLPSISSLLAIEAVDRLGTAIAAAEELSLSHSAVSRQLKVLEDQLGVAMLVRDGRGLALTKAGARYAGSVRQLLNDLAIASLELKASGNRNSLNLAVLPAFAMYWLTPRLKRFCARHSDIYINQRTRLSPFDMSLEDFDAAIHFGARDWAGVEYLELAREKVIPVCAASQAPATIPDVNDLLEAPLLHLDSRPGAWEEWFARKGLTATRLRGMLFDQFANLAAATAAGLGISLMPHYLAEPEIAAGRLAPLDRGYSPANGAYYLVWPAGAPPADALSALLEWLTLEIPDAEQPASN